MARDECEVKARVLFVSFFHEFEGDAIITHPDPKFVIGLSIEDRDSLYQSDDSDVRFPVHTVAVFAIQSVVKLFFDREVLNNVYNIQIKRLVIADQEVIQLSVV